MSQLPDHTEIAAAELADGDLLLVRDVSVTGDANKDKKLTIAAFAYHFTNISQEYFR
jgi:hypothetical protein